MVYPDNHMMNPLMKPLKDPALKVFKERKKHDRFNGMPEEEVSKRTLPDHLTQNLDIVIVSFMHILLLIFSYLYFNKLINLKNQLFVSLL